ncbi:ATP synthase subunit C [Dictyoglomus thermophilum]|uniref:ATP synthase subunit c n=2 Tax=Dictyoglomus thermophilum TaxID=14 RepID=ATPL_DICT6|nr:ATP synthase subunit C [Dictyoglomus thermophilum]B5YBQ2.1 RecName: Full=ATP synthase subunit c; AltName: Full=ATP synthase F(0) sector subunit c; AltName: Full=F-type ATPase subunit c; Short=F-ATPase subunit c; AltName: Full=Lipid-binding protein [Dictyoglomus thermophilum H-6-12]ACI19079.1 ATP synthase C chain [Dictyoglomus thermophilum H-6-12]MCX7720708.1 ATP synthase subunit C [Dictyoglomus thermophilum]TYT24156.1 ATP synthase subunit C [Dictyoglomus thermophilum]
MLAWVIIVSIITAGLSVALVGMNATKAQGNAAASALESVARQPEAGDQINRMLLFALAFIETIMIFTLTVALILLFANPLLGKL